MKQITISSLVARRGRAWQCLRCVPPEEMLGEKSKVVQHFYAKHVINRKDQPYLCGICDFSSSRQQQMERHPKFYKPHQDKIEALADQGVEIDETAYMLENENAYVVKEGIDIVVKGKDFSEELWQSRRRKVNVDSQGIVENIMPQLMNLGDDSFLFPGMSGCGQPVSGSMTNLAATTPGVTIAEASIFPSVISVLPEGASIPPPDTPLPSSSAASPIDQLLGTSYIPPPLIFADQTTTTPEYLPKFGPPGEETELSDIPVYNPTPIMATDADLLAAAVTSAGVPTTSSSTPMSTISLPAVTAPLIVSTVPAMASPSKLDDVASVPSATTVLASLVTVSVPKTTAIAKPIARLLTTTTSVYTSPVMTSTVSVMSTSPGPLTTSANSNNFPPEPVMDSREPSCEDDISPPDDSVSISSLPASPLHEPEPNFSLGPAPENMNNLILKSLGSAIIAVNKTMSTAMDYIYSGSQQIAEATKALTEATKENTKAKNELAHKIDILNCKLSKFEPPPPHHRQWPPTSYPPSSYHLFGAHHKRECEFADQQPTKRGRFGDDSSRNERVERRESSRYSAEGRGDSDRFGREGRRESREKDETERQNDRKESKEKNEKERKDEKRDSQDVDRRKDKKKDNKEKGEKSNGEKRERLVVKIGSQAKRLHEQKER